MSEEHGFGTTIWQVQRWDADQVKLAQDKLQLAKPEPEDFARLGLDPYSVTATKGNLITNAGYTRLGNLFTGQGATQAFDAAHCRIGAGNGSTAVTYADTVLSAAAGSTNRWFQLVSAVFTIGATRTWTVAATFGTADGNFTWQEFGIDQGTASGNTEVAILFNHALSSQGTKASGQIWTATATITFT
jgi:hypothetical protein